MRTTITTILAFSAVVACGGSSPAPAPTTPTVAAMPPEPVGPPTPPVPAAPPPNPLVTASTLYLQAPPFDLIREEHYMPAFDEGMKQELAEMRTIADQAAAPTFDNTIVAMERAGQTLRRVNYVFGNLSGSMDDAMMDKIQNDVAPLLAKHSDDVHLDPKLFARVDTLYKQRDKLGLDAVDKRLLERYHLDFVRAGAQLSAADQADLRKLNEEESTLVAKFSELQLKEMNAGAIVVDDVAQLDGMSQSDIAAAAAAAATRKLADKWVIPLVNTTGQPALASLKNRALRQKIYEASIARGHHGGEIDVTKLVARLAQIRATARQAARVRERRRVHPRRSDGEDARGRDEAAGPARHRCGRARQVRGRRDAEGHRRAARRLQATAVGLGRFTRSRCARRSTRSTRRRSGRTSSSTTSSRTACSSPRTSSTA